MLSLLKIRPHQRGSLCQLSDLSNTVALLWQPHPRRAEKQNQKLVPCCPGHPRLQPITVIAGSQGRGPGEVGVNYCYSPGWCCKQA